MFKRRLVSNFLKKRVDKRALLRIQEVEELLQQDKYKPMLKTIEEDIDQLAAHLYDDLLPQVLTDIPGKHESIADKIYRKVLLLKFRTHGGRATMESIVDEMIKRALSM